MIKRYSTQIKARIGALTFHKDSDSDYSAKLDRLEEAEHEARDAGLKKVSEEEWRCLQEELLGLKDEHEHLFQSHKSLL